MLLRTAVAMACKSAVRLSKRRTNFVPLGRRNRVPVWRPWAESPLKKSRRPCLSLRLFGCGLGQRSSPRIRDRQVVQNWSAAYTAVYTANPLSGDGISIDVEYIPSRRLGLRGSDYTSGPHF